jgi:glycosyltransferase involved in cell wall biosynthesis
MTAPMLTGDVTGTRPTVSVIIAAFSSERWESLREAVASVAAQTSPVLETIVVIDHNPDLLTRARRELAAVVIPNAGAQGASGARNTGVAHSRGEVVAFLDDDEVATSNWLGPLLAHFADPGVVGAGGRLDPLWGTARPRWFPGEFGWTIGVSYTGMPERTARVRNVWAGNMAVRRAAFEAAGGFREDFGKVGATSRPEDTDLCMRVNGGAWLYDPDCVVSHRVPAQRASFRYFLVRCFNEGRGKAGLAALNDARTSTSEERGYATRLLPRAILRCLGDVLRGDGAGALRGAAIIAGLGVAAAGFAVGGAATALSRAARPTGASR